MWIGLLTDSPNNLIYIGNRVQLFFMLIILPKRVVTLVILNDVHYHKYHHWPELRRGHKTTPALSCSFLISELSPIFSGARSFYNALDPGCSRNLGHPFGLPSGRSLPHCPNIAFRRSSSGNALATWPNKYHWFELVTSLEKNNGSESQFLGANCSQFLNLVISQMFRSSNCMSNNKKYSWFKKKLCWNKFLYKSVIVPLILDYLM